MDAKGWDARYAGSATPVWHTGPNIWVREVAEPLAPGRAVDLAAGEGRHAIWLAERGWTVDAFDFSAVGLSRGRSLAHEKGVAGRITWTVADVVATTPARCTFDLAVIAYLHLPAGDLRVVVRAAALSLAPGGTLLVVGHHLANLSDGVGGPHDPSILYTPDDVAAHLDGTGLAIARAETARRVVPGAGRRALDAVVVARRPL